MNALTSEIATKRSLRCSHRMSVVGGEAEKDLLSGSISHFDPNRTFALAGWANDVML
jgi:hypothetical protein